MLIYSVNIADLIHKRFPLLQIWRLVLLYPTPFQHDIDTSNSQKHSVHARERKHKTMHPAFTLQLDTFTYSP